MRILDGEMSSENKGTEIKLPEIDNKLMQLKSFEADLQNEEVVRARAALRKVFDPKFEWLNSQGIIITFHGSLQYSDPHNLDVDVELVGGDNLFFDESMRKIIAEFGKKFEEFGTWPRKNCDTNIGVSSIDTIRNSLSSLKKEGGRYYNPKEEYEAFPHTDAALILSSAVLYESQKPQLEILRGQVRQLILNNSFLRKGVLDELNGVIKVRQKRREEISRQKFAAT